MEYSVSELEGKVEELQSKIVVFQNSKLKIQEGVGERRQGLIRSIDFTISSVLICHLFEEGLDCFFISVPVSFGNSM